MGDHLEVLLNRVERGQSKNILGCGAGGSRDCRLSDPFRKRSPSSTVVDTVTAPEKRVQRHRERAPGEVVVCDGTKKQWDLTGGDDGHHSR